MTRQKKREKEIHIDDDMNAWRRNRKQINSIKIDHEIKHKNDKILWKKLQNQTMRIMSKI